MKKYLLIVLCLLATAGVSFAQDVYSAGYYINENGKNEAVLFKNDERIQVWGDGTNDYDYNSTSVLVDPYSGDVYWTKNVKNSSGVPTYGDIMKGGVYFMNTPSGSKNYLNQLYWHRTTNQDPEARIFTAGYRLGSDNNRYAAIWRGSNTSPLYSPDFENGNESEALDVCVISSPGNAINIFFCGYVYESGVRHATVWKNGIVLYTLTTTSSSAISMDYYDGAVYTLVNEYNSSTSNTVVKVFKNSNLLYTLTDASHSANSYQIKVDGGDVYVCGWGTTRAQYVWKNGQPYSTLGSGGSCPSLYVTTDAVFAARVTNGNAATIYKNETALYELPEEKCSYVADIAVTESCDVGEIGMLPFYETFEMGNTQWLCWTTQEEAGPCNFNADGSSEFASYFHRFGSNPTATSYHIVPATGDYCVRHRYHTEYDQEGWLIWPQKFFLQNGRPLISY